MKYLSLPQCLLAIFLGFALSYPAQAAAGQSTLVSDSSKTAPGTLVLSEALPSGGTLALTMNVGDLRIVPSTESNRVRLEIQGDATAEEERSWVKQFGVAGDRATIEIRAPKDHEHCVSCYSGRDVTVYIPQQTSIKLQLEVGDVAIHGVRGDKQIRIGIGDLSVAVRDPAEYDEVALSTRIGDVNDSVYHSQPHGFLGKDESIERVGRYHLRVHIGIGDLTLVQEKQ